MTTLSCYTAVKRTDRTTDYSPQGLLNKTSARFHSSVECDRPMCVAPFVNAVFVGDRSGSMGAMGSVPAEGAMEFASKYSNMAKKNPHCSVSVSVVTFDDRAEKMDFANAAHITHVDIRSVGEKMIPRGCTRLYDTAIEAIIDQQWFYMEIKKKISKLPNEVRLLDPQIALMFTLLTDGEDNSSNNTKYDLAEHIREHKKFYGASCFFAAANQDAMYAGATYGFDRDNSLQIGNDIEEARMAFRSCTNASMRAASGRECSYTTAEREASCVVDFDGDGSDGYGDDGDGYDYNTPPPRAMRC